MSHGFCIALSTFNVNVTSTLVLVNTISPLLEARDASQTAVSPGHSVLGFNDH